MATIHEAMAEKTPALMAIPEVTGVGQGETADGKECIVVMVTHRPPEIETTDFEATISAILEGQEYPVEIRVVGVIQAL